jgi:zinc protease
MPHELDEAMYMLELPTDKGDIVTKAHRHGRFCRRADARSTEIDKERGVVIEEWRGGRGPAAHPRPAVPRAVLSLPICRAPADGADIIRNAPRLRAF